MFDLNNIKIQHGVEDPIDRAIYFNYLMVKIFVLAENKIPHVVDLIHLLIFVKNKLPKDLEESLEAKTKELLHEVATAKNSDESLELMVTMFEKYKKNPNVRACEGYEMNFEYV